MKKKISKEYYQTFNLESLQQLYLYLKKFYKLYNMAYVNCCHMAIWQFYENIWQLLYHIANNFVY